MDAFVWNQTYGPLHWPRKGHVVMTVDAGTADYWKAEDLDVFNGTAWVAGSVGSGPLPRADARGARRLVPGDQGPDRPGCSPRT